MMDVPGAVAVPATLVELDRGQALALLASVGYGRIVFTLHALPAIRPVNHVVDDGQIIIRTRLTAKVADAVGPPRSTVVAYQADLIDPVERTGWSVAVTGIARPVTNPERVARYEQILRPWIDTVLDTVITIQPDIVTGFRLTRPR